MYLRKRLSVEITSIAAVAVSISSGVMADAQPAIEEVVVSATRRAATVQDIPYNISAVTGETIAKRGIGNVNELIKSIPGVGGPDLGARAGINNTVVMRGINVSDAGQNTVSGNMSVAPVSMYINDTPMFTNLKLMDLERVEVLRGPQGTLYGSGAMGGTLRFISKKPVIGESDTSIQVGFSDNAEGNGFNNEIQLISNIPVSDALAMRVALSRDEQEGVVDATRLVVTDDSGAPVLSDPANVDSGYETTTKDDVDGGDIFSAKFSVLWQPTDDTEVVFNYQFQDEDWDHGTTAYIGTDASLGGGADSWEDSVNQLDSVEREVNVASLDVNHEFGFASFTSSTSVTNDESKPFRDSSGFYTNLDVNLGYYYGFPRILVKDQIEEERDTFTQELRLVSNGEGPIDWVVGAFYSKEEAQSTNLNQMPGLGDWADDPAALGGGAPIYLGYPTIGDFIESYLGGVRPSLSGDTVYTLATETEFEDKAIFGELSWHVIEQWQMTVGGRFFRQTIDRSMVQTLPLCGAGCSDDLANPNGLTQSASTAKFSDHIFKLNTSYDVSETTMVYLTVSEGFRRGGANALPTAGGFYDPNYPLDYEPDTLLNKEVGVKGYLADGRVSYTASLFDIDWKNVQLENFTAGGFKGVANAEDARSQGVELEMNAAITESLNINLGYSYVDAEITKDASAGSNQVFKGDDLPYVARNQANFSLDYGKDLSKGYELVLHLDGNYRSGVNTQPNTQQTLDNYAELGSYSIWNTAATVSRDKWSLQFYVKNLTNEDGLSSVFELAANGAGAPAEFDRRGWVNRPRTMGLRFNYGF